MASADVQVEPFGDPADAVRRVLEDAEEAILGVAFVHRRGVSLIERQLRSVGRGRLIATTVFGSTTAQGLEAASDAGFGVRVLNLSHGTFHPEALPGPSGRGDYGGDRLGEPHHRADRQCRAHRGVAWSA